MIRGSASIVRWNLKLWVTSQRLGTRCENLWYNLGILLARLCLLQTNASILFMGRSRYKFLEQYPHFLTCTVVNWLPVFSQPQLAQIITNSLDFLHSHKRLTLHGYVIMENHLHLIASAENLSKEITTFKSFTARSIIDTLK